MSFERFAFPIVRQVAKRDRLSAVLNRAFTPRTVAAMEPVITSVTHELLAELRPDRRFDAMEQLASRLPVYVISDVLGFPPSERNSLKQLSDVIAAFADPLTGFDPPEVDAAIKEFAARTDALIDARQEDPAEDMISALVAVEAEGHKLSRRELISMVLLLMLAGNETTSNLIGNALVALDEHRGARALLLQREDLDENAIEELLRFDTPVQVTDRRALADFEVAGVTVPAGASIVVLLGAANRDPDRYEAPDELRLDRTDPRPLSFGHGAHHCLGAGLARIEARVAVPAFVRAFPDHQVARDEVTWNRSITLRGPKILPIDGGLDRRSTATARPGPRPS